MIPKAAGTAARLQLECAACKGAADEALLRCGPAAGDVVGALWNRMDGAISFFKNGVALGEAFTGVRHDKLYPTVGLRTTGEEVPPPCAASSTPHLQAGRPAY